MIRSVLRWLRQVSRRIHVRVILYAVLNVPALLIAVFIGPWIPPGLANLIGADAVDTILQVLAASMLTVVTFSLTIMVTSFARAEQQWTPRIHILMREDTRTQSVLATFLGSYLYALVAIILRAADVFGENEMVVVFAMTVFVVGTIIVSIIRWIVHLEGLGSLPATARDLQTRAADAIEDAAARPCQGANPLTADIEIPEDARPVTSGGGGYVQQVYEEALQDLADRLEAWVFVTVPVGRFVQKGEELARVAGLEDDLSDDDRAAIRAAIPVADTRSFDMDPVFGVTVLGEVATRALSPGVNDPGTAIDIVHRLSHVLCAGRDGPDENVADHDRVWIAPVDPDALFEASFDPITRCAGSAVEVHLAIQRALASVQKVARPAMRKAAADAAARHARRALEMVENPDDRTRLEDVVSRAGVS